MPNATKTLLPFAAAAKANSTIFNDDIEKTTVFCITELNREKGGGFIRKQAPEKLVFISKVYYPFWLAPYKNSTLLLDGLNASSHSITYLIVPDLKAFKENLNGRSVTRQVHVNFLSNNQNYFQCSGEEHRLVIEGLLNDAEFTQEFLNYAKEATTTDSPIIDSILITPALDENGVMRMLQNLENARLKLVEELADLNEIIKLLNQRTQESLASLREEIESIERAFNIRIQKVKSTLENTLTKINKEYSAKVTGVSNKYEQEITSLQKEYLKLEKTKEQLNAEIERAEAEIRTSAINKDDSGEQKWKEKRNELKDELPEVSARLKAFETQIREIEEKRKSELFLLKQDNDAKIKEASKDLIELEASRDAEVKTCQNEMEKIEDLTSNVIMKVDEMAKNRETVILEFDELGIRQKRTEPSLIHMPFYLSCYQSKSNKRCTYLAPSTISGEGLGLRLKTVGKTKISQMFQPRSKKIASILNTFIGILEENIVFNHEISEACLKANLLQMEKTQEAIRNGLRTLKEKDWLSDSEFEAFSQAFSQSLL